MADNSKPNSLQASYAKAKAGRACVDIALRCVALCGTAGYGEDELLEKWARDAKILDIFEGTQQIQLLIIARQLLGKSSAELRVNSKTRPVAVLGGNRIPFARSNGAYAKASNQDMLTAALDGLVDRVGPRRRADRRDGRRRRPQAQPRLQPDARVRSGLEAGARDVRLRRRPGVRHRPRGGHPGRQQDRPRPGRLGDRRRRRHHLRRADRPQRRPPRDPAGGEQREVQPGACEGADQVPPGDGRARDPAQRRAPHRPLDGRAHGDHGHRMGRDARGAGRARGSQPPEPRGRV